MLLTITEILTGLYSQGESPLDVIPLAVPRNACCLVAVDETQAYSELVGTVFSISSAR